MNLKSATLFLLLAFITFPVLAQDDDVVEGDAFPKVRLAYTAPSGFYRQVLIGFQAGVCTDAIDPGYDAVTNVTLPSDMYFWCNNQPLFIQGVGAFANTNTYPLGVKSNQNGMMSIALVSTENFDNTHSIYIYDSLNDSYHNLKNGSFTADIEAGTFNERFALRFFQQSTLGVGETQPIQDVNLSYLNASKSILIEGLSAISATSTVSLLSMTGQNLGIWEIKADSIATSSTIPVSNLATGNYVLRLQADNRTVVKKIAVR